VSRHQFADQTILSGPWRKPICRSGWATLTEANLNDRLAAKGSPFRVDFNNVVPTKGSPNQDLDRDRLLRVKDKESGKVPTKSLSRWSECVKV
jgi:hypothetical protein